MIKPEKPWPEIAEHVCKEQDPNKLTKLVQDVVTALDENKKPIPHPETQKSRLRSAQKLLCMKLADQVLDYASACAINS